MRRVSWVLLTCLVAVAGVVSPAALPSAGTTSAFVREQVEAGYGRENLVSVRRISYIAHNGVVRPAYVLLPRWYGPLDDPPIPLVISPHGRGIGARANARRWGNLPALGSFAVVCPDGQGRRLGLFAWGDPGDIADLARMPRVVEAALPFVHVDRRRIYAFGSSMGGQETLLLLARHPHLLAGAAAFDSDTNLAARYWMFPSLPFGSNLQRMLRREVGGTPTTDPRAYRLRSPLTYARAIAFSGVPLQIWWSRRDRIVRDQQAESGLLYRRILHWDPTAPVTQIVGDWDHSADFRAVTRLPFALRRFSLLPPRGTIERPLGGGHGDLPGIVPPPDSSPALQNVKQEAWEAASDRPR
jgi:pimeloyl-ACP methyl ester carboxylesterase